VGGSIGPKEIIKRIAKLNVNAESCTTHFIQNAMVEALNGDQSGSKNILNTLKDRRDATAKGLNAIDGINIVAPRTTFYLFPNVTKIMERKGFHKIEDLQNGALSNANVSFCTREHFGRAQADERDYYIRLAYSGISVEDINEGQINLKDFFESQ
ncbi:MAG: aspartate aminotransferase, partial [Candidatus Neomarinimicrobiota bacterium]|nr:aspartate aminotransferase [Candidatus Neomarinimicrobiota bacterium]